MNEPPEDPAVLNQLGTHFVSVGDFNKASKYFAEAVILDEDEVEYQINLANVYYALGEFRLCYQTFAQAIETAPNRSDIQERCTFLQNSPHIYLAGALQGSHAPQRQVFMSAALDLFKNQEEPLRILEIGSYMGSSLLTWAHAANKLYGSATEITCVDPWGDVGVVGYSDEVTAALELNIVYEVFRHNASLCPKSVSILEFRGASQKVLPNFKNNHFDVIYVDGCHFFDEVYQDIVISDKLLKEGGVICGDDLELQLNDADAEFALKNLAEDFVLDPKSNVHFHPGVTLAVDKFFGEVSNYEGFWIMQKSSARYEKISLGECRGTLPFHWPDNYRQPMRRSFEQSKSLPGVTE